MAFPIQRERRLRSSEGMRRLVRECQQCQKLGVSGIILFGIPAHKDEMAAGAFDEAARSPALVA
jgi:delta-aminolevulinic acid dehydratase/porphobilinogen synthase